MFSFAFSSKESVISLCSLTAKVDEKKKKNCKSIQV